MVCKRFKATAPLLVPLFLVSAAALAAVPRGWVVGPAPSQTLSQLGNGNSAVRGLQTSPAGPSALGPCKVYFDATGQLSFMPPAANTSLMPGINSLNLVTGGPAFAHGIVSTPAMASGLALTADAQIDGVTLQQPNGTVSQQVIKGVAYFATSPACGPGSFSSTLQSNPMSAAPGSTVLAVSTRNPSITLTASYSTSFSSDGVTYTCIFGNGNGNGKDCEVWRVDVVFSFLTNNLPANGADEYALSINQVTLSSP